MSDELQQFATDLGAISDKALPEVQSIFKASMVDIKKGMNQNFYNSKHFKGAGGSVHFDSMHQVGAVVYEIGPDKNRRGGAIGNVAYFGTSRGGGTVDFEGPYLRELPVVEKYMDALVANWIGSLL